MARLAPERTPYDLALARGGFYAPAKSNAYVRGREGGLVPAPADFMTLGSQYERDVAAFSVRQNPGYWKTAAGQAEIRQREQAELGAQLDDLRLELERQSQIVQTGAHVFSEAELEQRREIFNAGATQASALAPFVSTGMIDAGAVRQQIGKAVSDSFAEQRQVRNAEKDVRLLTERANTSQYDLRQIAGAREEMIKRYGERVLMRVPGWREIEGTEGIFRNQINEQVKAYEATTGVPGRWDERAGEVVADERLQLAQIRQESIEGQKIDKLSARATVVKNQLDILGSLIQAKEKAGQPVPPAYTQRYNDYLNEYLEAYRPIREALGMKTHGARPSTSDVADVPDLAKAIANTPAQPVRAPVARKQYATRAEAIADAKAGRIAVDEPVAIEGIPATLTQDGRFQRVR